MYNFYHGYVHKRQRIKIIQTYYKNERSLKLTFCNFFGVASLPNESIHSVHVKPKTGRSKSACTEENKCV